MIKPRLIDLRFPVGGLVKKSGYQTQPPYTTPDCSNVRPSDTLEGRERGGSRPGTVKIASTVLGSGTPVRLLHTMMTIPSEGVATITPYTVLDKPSFIALNGTNLYVSHGAPNHLVRVYHSETGEVLFTIGAEGAGDGQFSSPAGLALDTATDELFVADSGNHRIEVFTASTGAYLRQFGTNGTGDGQFDTPMGLALYNAELYVCDRKNNRVQVFNPTTGAYVRKWGTYGTGNSNYFYPTGIAVNANGAYVADSSNYRVVKTDTSGTYSAKTDASASQPLGVAVDTDGLVYVTRPSEVQVFTSGLVASRTFGSYGFTTGKFATPYGVVATATAVYVADNYNANVQEFGKVTSRGAQEEVVVASAGAGFYRLNGAVWDAIPSAALSTDKPLRAASWGNQYLYIADYGTTDILPQRYDLIANEVTNWTDATVERPTGCPLICRYMDRIVLAGNPPHQWYMSRQGDPGDWCFDAPASDLARPLWGQDSEAGQIGEPITALIPWRDDYLVMGCTHSLWVMRGVPTYGGRIDALSRSVGIVDGGAYCHGPDGEILFLSAGGVYLLPPGASAAPVAVSEATLPQELKGVDPATHWVHMAFDVKARGVHILVTSMTAGTSDHWWMDWESKSFWPVAYADTGHDPTYAIPYNGDVLLGCRDGYVRKHSEAATTDDGTAITSYVLYGPMRTSGDDWYEGLVMEMTAALDEQSGDAAWEVRVGDTCEEAVSASAFTTGVWSAGANHSTHVRARGAAYAVKVGSSSGSQWVVERMTAKTRPTGKLRV